MSEATILTPPPDTQPNTHNRLNEAQRRAIVARYMVLGSIGQTAQEFGVHRNTVSTLVNSVRNVENSPLSADWRKKLTDTLPNLSVDAIERSISDLEDPHKAASTALAHLKGIGALQGEGTTVNVFVGSISNMPADLAEDYFEVEHTPIPEDGSET